MKSPSVSENVKIEPATMPGQRERQDDRAQRRKPRAPRSRDASSSESGMRSSAAYTGRIMNGSQMYEKTSHIAQFGVAETECGQAELAERPVEHAVLGEDQPPGVDAREVARPQRQEDADEQERARARRSRREP